MPLPERYRAAAEEFAATPQGKAFHEYRDRIIELDDELWSPLLAEGWFAGWAAARANPESDDLGPSDA